MITQGAKRLTSPGHELPQLARRGLLCVLAALAAVQLYLQARGGHYGYDFRGGTWAAGRALLRGASPFPVADPAHLLAHSNEFITPPPLALLGAPFSLLPFGVAIVVFNIVCMAGLAGALWVLGVRRGELYLLAACSFPSVASLCLGQPDGLFALGAALAWRYRASARGAVAGGAVIAAKLLAWPLVIWLIVTRRYRQAALTAGSALAILLGSWSLIGFQGMLSYPRLLSADAEAFGTKAHSILTALWRVGVPLGVAMAVTLPLAVVIAALAVHRAGRSDLGWFTAAVILGILASPVVWQHYFLLLFVPLAASRREHDPVTWVLVLLMWLSPTESPGTVAQAWLIPTLAAALALRIAGLSRPAPRAQPSVTRERARPRRLETSAAGASAGGSGVG